MSWEVRRVLRLEQGHISAPGPDEARIRVHAIGLNRAYVMFRRGRCLEKASLTQIKRSGTSPSHALVGIVLNVTAGYGK